MKKRTHQCVVLLFLLFTTEISWAMLVPYAQNNAVQYGIFSLPTELHRPIFNQLPDKEKDSLMKTCHYWHNFGKISPKTIPHFIFDPELACSDQARDKLAQTEINFAPYDNGMVLQMNPRYASSRQAYLCSSFRDMGDRLNAQVDEKLRPCNLIRNCCRISQYCLEIEGKALGDFNQLIYKQCELESAMGEGTQLVVHEVRDSVRKSIQLPVLVNCAKFRLFALGNLIFCGVGVFALTYLNRNK